MPMPIKVDFLGDEETFRKSDEDTFLGTVADDEETDNHTTTASATISHRPSQLLSPADMSTIGLKVKRVLDHGRVMFLRSLGLEAYQVIYFYHEHRITIWLLVNMRCNHTVE